MCNVWKEDALGVVHSSNSSDQVLSSLMCDCMIEGNNYYDEVGVMGYLSCEEVANLLSRHWDFSVRGYLHHSR